MSSRKSNTQTGREGEQLAHAYLQVRGYEIIEHNWRCPAGEIDLVARDGVSWVFVEVKTRRSNKFGMPEEAITRAKQRRLLDCGLTYMAEHALDDAAWRIDVVSIMLGRGSEPAQIQVYRNAVSADGSI